MPSKAKAAEKIEKTEETTPKKDDGKVQISFRLFPEQVAALSLLATLRGHAKGAVGQARWAVIMDALSRLIETDESLAPFEDRFASVLDTYDWTPEEVEE